MKLDHINLTVEDVTATRQFLETYFGLHPAGAQSANMAFLTDDNRSLVTLMKGKIAAYPATFHIGFNQPNREAVDALYARLRQDGFEVAEPRNFHGSWTFYVPSPGGFSVEVQCWLGE